MTQELIGQNKGQEYRELVTNALKKWLPLNKANMLLWGETER